MPLAGVPLFLANAAVSSWIKFTGNELPGILVSVFQALAIAYLAFSHARWVKHLVGGSIRPSLQVRPCLTCNNELSTIVSRHEQGCSQHQAQARTVSSPARRAKPLRASWCQFQHHL